MRERRDSTTEAIGEPTAGSHARGDDRRRGDGAGHGLREDEGLRDGGAEHGPREVEARRRGAGAGPGLREDEGHRSDAGRDGDDSAATSPSDDDAGLSTIRERPRASGSTIRGRKIEESAALSWIAPRVPRRRAAPALMLSAMVIGTCLWVYVTSCMSKETGEENASGVTRGALASAGSDGVTRVGQAGSGADGASSAGQAGAGSDAAPEAAGLVGATGRKGQAIAGDSGGPAGESGSVAEGAGGLAAAGAEIAGSMASVEAGAGGIAAASAEGAAAGESLWVAVAQADSEAAERRRRIAAQVRALTAEPRILGCLLGHVPMGVGRRTTLTGSVVVAGGGEVVRATIRAGEGRVPASARACVVAELEKTRFAAGPQAQLAVPLRLEIL